MPEGSSMTFRGFVPAKKKIIAITFDNGKALTENNCITNVCELCKIFTTGNNTVYRSANGFSIVSRKFYKTSEVMPPHPYNRLY